MAALYDPNKYDPNLIIQAADEKLEGNDFSGAQILFQSALLDWVDDAREGSGGDDPEQLREAVATLWLAYAHFLVKTKQFKSATEAYEQSLACPVAGSVGRVYLDYARFSTDRGKLRTAQDAYIRALVGKNGESAAVQDEQDQTLLWSEFLEMMRVTTPDLTMQDLQAAVESEAAVAAGESGSTALPQSVHSTMVPTVDDASAQSPPAKRVKHEDTTYLAAARTEESKTHVVTAESVEAEAASFSDIIRLKALPPEIAGAWMIRDGNAPPQAPQPSLFGPAPPKLSDPTGKDLLGGDLALAIIDRLVGPSGNVILSICSALWTLAALKEKEATAAVGTFDETMKTESTRLEASLAERLSVAGAASTAVEQMNSSERRSFQSACGQQRVSVLSAIAWDFRQLLCVQQQVLTKLNVPGFESPTVDSSALQLQSRICSFLHSAFYLRKRIGEPPHLSMLKSQAERLRRDNVPISPSFGSNTNIPHGSYSMPQQRQQQHAYQQPQHLQPQQPHVMQGYGYPGQVPMPGHNMPPPNQQQQEQYQQHGHGAPQYPYYQ